MRVVVARDETVFNGKKVERPKVIERLLRWDKIHHQSFSEDRL